MEVVHILPALTKGGGEKVAVELANKACAEGDRVSFVIGWPVDPLLLQTAIHPSIPVHFVASNKRAAFLKLPFWIFSNRKKLSANNVVHCHLLYGSFFGAICYFFKRILGLKKTVIVETNHSVGMTITPFKLRLFTKFAALKDGIVFMAKDEHWSTFMQRQQRLQFATIANGISVPDKDKLTSTLHSIPQIQNAKYVVGTVGMLRADRQPHFYVLLFENIYKALGKDVHFVLGGGGEAFDTMQAMLATKAFKDQFHMIGLVDNPYQLYPALQVYVSLSVGEITGLSMIEAAMSKVPVVGIQLTPQHQLTEKDWTWSSESLEAVAEKIVDLLKDPILCQQYQQQQYELVMQKFTVEAMYQSYMVFYKKLLAAVK